MAKIAIFPLPEAGHVNATLGLAKRLKRRGHEVVYLGPPDLRARIAPQGLGFVELFESVLPSGWFDRQSQKFATLEGIALSRAQSEWHALAHDWLVEGRGDACLRAIGADLFIVDADFLPLRVVLHWLGHRFMTFHSTLARFPEREHPPMVSHLVYDPSLKVRVKIQLSLFMRDLLFAGYKRILRGNSKSALDSPAFQRMVKSFAAQHGDVVPFHPRSRFTKLVLCPSELDFPRALPAPRAYHCGPAIDLTRQEPAFSWARIDEDRRPLVYCSLGSQGYRARGHADFLREVIRTFEDRKDLQLLIAVGDALDPAEFTTSAPNVHVAGMVPQLGALARASLAITHGGLNTVKECVYYGVPMLVFPMDFDQPGNAARVVYHGLGLRGSIRNGSAHRLSAMIDEILRVPSYRENVKRLSAIFRAYDEQDTLAEIIEAEIGSPGASRARA